MVSTERTQPGNTPHPRPTDWDVTTPSASVRITAIRRQGITQFLSDALTVQRAVTEGERIDRESSNTGLRLHTQADLKVSNAAAVQQWIASNLAAFGDENRDFPAVTPR